MKYHQPNQDELPSMGKLVKSTFKALVGAAILLVAVIFPAEYGIDPTKMGSLLGLTRMGEIKQQLADEANEEQETVVQVVDIPPVAQKEVPKVQEQAPQTVEVPQSKTEELIVILASDKAIEIKADMKQGATMQFSWKAEGGNLNYDSHGEASGSSRLAQYDKGMGINQKQGEIRAPFDGTHGWYWRNRSGNEVKITISATGDFGSLKQVD